MGGEVPGWIWVHAVSVGEVLAATELVRGLGAAGYRVAVSTTTEAGQGLARERFAGSPVFYMPLDFGFLVRRYLRAIRPRLVVTMESELWPNLIGECRKAGVPLAVANARVSDRSFPRYMRLRRLWGPLLREVSLFLAQSEETAGRLRAMGVAAERVVVTGNLKYDVRVAGESELTGRVRRLTAGCRVIVAGSTLAGEEEMVLEAFAAVRRAADDAVLVIAPRHRDRFDEVARMAERAGFAVCRCSALPKRVVPGTVLVLDTIGDLASMYSVAAVAFVGGSLVAKGGHNPLEPAQFGVPVVMGESVFNFREIAGAMCGAEGLRLVGRDGLGEALVALLERSSGSEARAVGERGRAVFAGQAGATGRTVAALLGLMDGGGG